TETGPVVDDLRAQLVGGNVETGHRPRLSASSGRCRLATEYGSGGGTGQATARAAYGRGLSRRRARLAPCRLGSQSTIRWFRRSSVTHMTWRPLTRKIEESVVTQWNSSGNSFRKSSVRRLRPETGGAISDPSTSDPTMDLIRTRGSRRRSIGRSHSASAS